MENQLSLTRVLEFDNEDKEQESVEQINSSSKVRSTRENFDCCSLFRDCSENKQCLYEDTPCSYDPDKHLFCNYRTKLNQGAIYYGKKAPGFSEDKYRTFVLEYNSLNDEQRELLKDIYFKLAICCQRRIKIDRDFTSESLVGSRIINIREPSEADKKWLLNSVNYRQLRSESGHKSKRKEDLIAYILENDIDLVEKYCGHVLFAELDYDAKRYAVELYHDFMR